MIRNALLLCAGIIVAACFACAPAPVPPPPSPPAAYPIAPAVVRLQHRAQICDGTTVASFISAVKFVADGFDPDPTSGILPTTTNQTLGSLENDLAQAFISAPIYFKNQLCQLDGVFLTNGNQSWGYRDIGSGKRYIALSTSLWSGASAITLDVYENRVFPPLNWTKSLDPKAPSYQPAKPNVGPMTLLAVLAHEFGHVLWADILISPPGSNANSVNFCPSVVNGINQGILDNWWNGGPLPTTWTDFEAPDGNPALIPDGDPSDPPDSGDPPAKNTHVLDLESALGLAVPNYDRAHRILKRLLSDNRPFPSFLGAFSANEHFVETFMIYTAMHALPTQQSTTSPATGPLISAPLLATPQKTRDIPSDLLVPGTRPKLEKLIACFVALYPAGKP